MEHSRGRDPRQRRRPRPRPGAGDRRHRDRWRGLREPHLESTSERRRADQVHDHPLHRLNRPAGDGDQRRPAGKQHHDHRPDCRRQLHVHRYRLQLRRLRTPVRTLQLRHAERRTDRLPRPTAADAHERILDHPHREHPHAGVHAHHLGRRRRPVGAAPDLQRSHGHLPGLPGALHDAQPGRVEVRPHRPDRRADDLDPADRLQLPAGQILALQRRLRRRARQPRRDQPEGPLLHDLRHVRRRRPERPQQKRLPGRRLHRTRRHARPDGRLGRPVRSDRRRRGHRNLKPPERDLLAAGRGRPLPLLRRSPTRQRHHRHQDQDRRQHRESARTDAPELDAADGHPRRARAAESTLSGTVDPQRDRDGARRRSPRSSSCSTASRSARPSRRRRTR